MKNLKSKISIPAFLFLLVVAGTSNVNAQKAEFGIRFMPTASSIMFKNSAGGNVEGKAIIGIGFGAFLGINFSKNIGVQSEVIYNSLSQKFNDKNVDRKVTLRYVNVPVLLSINTDKSKPVNVNFVVGPQMGISAGSSVSSSNSGEADTLAPVLAIKKEDFGLAYGAGVDFALDKDHNFRLGIGFRGVYGLIDISDNSKSRTTNSFYILDRAHVNTYSGYVGLSMIF